MLFSICLAAILAWLLKPIKISPHDHATAVREFVAHNMSVTQPIHIRFGNRGFRFPDLVKATQAQLDYVLKQRQIPYKYVLIDNLPDNIERIPTEAPPIYPEAVLTDPITLTAISMVNSTMLEGHNKSEKISTFDFSKEAPEYTIELFFHEDAQRWCDTVELKAMLSYNLAMIHQNDLPFFLAQTILDGLLEAELDLWQKKQFLRFSTYIPSLKVNFVAAEESGKSSPEIMQAIKDHMAIFEVVEPLTKIEFNVEILDVSRKRAPTHLTKNTTTEITFFYLTTLENYANSVQGVPIRHLRPNVPVLVPTDPKIQGTEYQKLYEASQKTIFNVTSFLREASRVVEKSVYLTYSETPNLRLKAESAMKHFTLRGIVESLDLLLLEDLFDQTIYARLCRLVDTILTEDGHIWAQHLSNVYEIHGNLKGRVKSN